MDTPDTTLYEMMHRGQRVATRNMRDAIAEMTYADRGGRIDALRQWSMGFRKDLHVHHTVEDEIFFPALRERVPTAGALLDELDADHHILDDLLDESERAMDELAGNEVPFAAAQSRAYEAFAALERFLSDHLDKEDADIIPVFARCFDKDEYEALGDRANRYTKPTELGFVIPFVVAIATPEERELLWGDAPFVMRIVYRLTRGRYNRLTTKAFGSAAHEMQERA